MKLSPKNTYLFFDLDGTLIVDGKLSDETVNALNYAKNKGCKLYINTGRSRGNFLKAYDVIKDLPFDGFLCAGCSFYTGTGCENTVFDTLLSSDEVERLVRYACDKSYWFVVETLTTLYTCKIYGEVTYTKAQLEDFYNQTMANIKDEQVVKLTLYPPKGVKDDIILTKFDKYDWVVYPHCYELFHKGQTKGTILDKIRQTNDVKDGVFVAFGDSENDLDFFKHADISIAMQHATKPLKDLATYTATTPNGVAEMIYKLI